MCIFCLNAYSFHLTVLEMRICLGMLKRRWLILERINGLEFLVVVTLLYLSMRHLRTLIPLNSSLFINIKWEQWACWAWQRNCFKIIYTNKNKHMTLPIALRWFQFEINVNLHSFLNWLIVCVWPLTNCMCLTID